MMENLGGSELLVVMLVIFLFFGPKKFPELGRTFGKAMREFRGAMNGVRRDIENATKLDK